MDALLALGALVAVAAVAYLFLPRRRSPEAQARLERAASTVDTELSGNLELVTMFFQTKQSVVLENAAYRGARETIESADARVGARLDALYSRMPEAESAMERRGPAGSFREEDRRVVETWEGDARVLQRDLRALAASRPPTPAERLLVRLGGERQGGQRAD